MIKKILFITLSNIGDVVLTLPVLDFLKKHFPRSRITVLVGPRPKAIFEDYSYIDRLIVYDKYSGIKDKIKLFFELKKERFDMVVDLRNTLFGALLPARYKVGLFTIIPRNIKHMKDRHFYRLKGIISKLELEGGLDAPKRSFYVSQEDEDYINDVLKKSNITETDKLIVLSPGAKSHTKRWPAEKFLSLSSLLIEEFHFKIVLVGDSNDTVSDKYITRKNNEMILDLVGKTNLRALASLLRRSSLVVTNDSAVLHIASYFNIPTVAIFGISDENKYGPWSGKSAVVKKDMECRPCRVAQCKFGTLECIQSIKVQEVFTKAKEILLDTPRTVVPEQRYTFKRILIVRTDKIGDVLLSTPVIKALRDNYPDAYIAMMVSSYARDIVAGNPYLNEVIIYDKDSTHKGWLDSIEFANNLRGKRFDLALILHPTNRVHLLTFFAGIPRRIGYDRKLGFLLTDWIKHTKQLGEKHELEYNLDLIRYLDIEPKDKSLFMPIRLDSEKWVKELLRENAIGEDDRLSVIHPGASCPSKIWPNERFAEIADALVERYGFKILVVAGLRDIAIAQAVIGHMHHPAINLGGRTSVSELASLLKKCSLFISNDSGPVHIASAVGTPVISIFGRNQKGLSPLRWGPLGLRDRVLHKEVGCIQCLAHNCKKEFACLKAVTAEEVLKVVDEILK
jgi:heptosyltransferase-2